MVKGEDEGRKGGEGEGRRGTREEEGGKWEEEGRGGREGRRGDTDLLCYFIVLLNHFHWIAKLLPHIVH